MPDLIAREMELISNFVNAKTEVEREKYRRMLIELDEE